ncbi:hypothetical protein GGX14DRAFT_384677 [Mycena pura]|uniref:Uncharacterized protein n=1 Tax=Mycena pura TaxID=153505 RepID=A0AAD6YSZ2_9AGAR|nr:hypothetical protein GGX14DRAFT_384677 [Mycena pura]
MAGPICVKLENDTRNIVTVATGRPPGTFTLPTLTKGIRSRITVTSRGREIGIEQHEARLRARHEARLQYEARKRADFDAQYKAKLELKHAMERYIVSLKPGGPTQQYYDCVKRYNTYVHTFTLWVEAHSPGALEAQRREVQRRAEAKAAKNQGCVITYACEYCASLLVREDTRTLQRACTAGRGAAAWRVCKPPVCQPRLSPLMPMCIWYITGLMVTTRGIGFVELVLKAGQVSPGKDSKLSVSHSPKSQAGRHKEVSECRVKQAERGRLRVSRGRMLVSGANRKQPFSAKKKECPKMAKSLIPDYKLYGSHKQIIDVPSIKFNRITGSPERLYSVASFLVLRKWVKQGQTLARKCAKCTDGRESAYNHFDPGEVFLLRQGKARQCITVYNPRRSHCGTQRTLKREVQHPALHIHSRFMAGHICVGLHNDTPRVVVAISTPYSTHTVIPPHQTVLIESLKEKHRAELEDKTRPMRWTAARLHGMAEKAKRQGRYTQSDIYSKQYNTYKNEYDKMRSGRCVGSLVRRRTPVVSLHNNHGDVNSGNARPQRTHRRSATLLAYVRQASTFVSVGSTHESSLHAERCTLSEMGEATAGPTIGKEPLKGTSSAHSRSMAGHKHVQVCNNTPYGVTLSTGNNKYTVLANQTKLLASPILSSAANI